MPHLRDTAAVSKSLKTHEANRQNDEQQKVMQPKQKVLALVNQLRSSITGRD